jgi:hypothetical protein
MTVIKTMFSYRLGTLKKSGSLICVPRTGVLLPWRLPTFWLATWILILPKADSDDQLIDKCSDESDQIGGETQTNEKNKWTISSK